MPVMTEEDLLKLVKARDQGCEDAKALKVGDEFFGAAPAGKKRGYCYETPEMKFYIDGYLASLDSVRVTTDLNNIITKINKATTDKPYVLVEQAGYVGERDVDRFEDYRDALAAMRKEYDRDEIDELHVAIAYDGDEGRTYEVG